MTRTDAFSGSAPNKRRRTDSAPQEAGGWRQIVKNAYAGARPGAASWSRPQQPLVRPVQPDALATDELDAGLARALKVRLAPSETRRSGLWAAEKRTGELPADDRPPKRRSSNSNSAPPRDSGPHHYSTGDDYVLRDDTNATRGSVRQRSGRRKRDQAFASEWTLIEPDCSLPAYGYSPSYALYVAMVCQGRKATSPAHLDSVQASAAPLLFERAAPTSAESTATSATAPSLRRAAVTAAAVVTSVTSSRRIQTSTRPKNPAAVTPLAKAVITSGLTPAQASEAQRSALQSYIDSAFSAAASRLENPGATTSSSPSSSSSTPSGPATAYSNHHRNLARIIAPAVIVPVVVILAAMIIGCCLWRRRKRRRPSPVATPGRTTPSGIGPISHPKPLMATTADGTVIQPGGGFDDHEVLAAGAGGAAAGAGIGRALGGSSQDSVATTPSAIGVAFSEPRTPWGRRSLVDVFAGGVRSANESPQGSSSSPSHQRVLSTSSSFAGRQPSLKSSGSVPSELRGVGGYNIFGYQPGQPRPVVGTVGGAYDLHGPASIVPVPESAQRHSSEEGSISGYSGEGETAGTGHSVTGSAESYTARLAPPLGDVGYVHNPPAHQSRTTQRTSDGEQGYWTAEAGLSSTDGGHDAEEAEHLSESAGNDSSPLEEAVNFGSSGSSGDRSTSLHAYRSSEDSIGGGSQTSTPRLGAGHGSVGNRRNDGSGSWWNA